MSMIEAVALGVLILCAAVLVVLGVSWEAKDRRTPPPPALEHQPKHAVDNGETTRLRPPD